MNIIDLTRVFLFFFQLFRGALPPPAPLGGNGPLIGTARNGAPVHWFLPLLDTLASLAIFGTSGSGKTRLMAFAIALSLIRERQLPLSRRPARIIIDLKGDMTVAVTETLALLAPELLAHVTVLNPFADVGHRTGFAFNLNHLALQSPLDIRAFRLAQLVGNVSTELGGRRDLGIGARQQDTLQHTILAALDTDDPRASVLWAMDACMEKKGFEHLAAVTRSPRAKAFLTGARINDELKMSSASRLRLALAASASLETVVSTRAGCVQFDALTSPNQLVFLDLGRPTGGLTSLSVFWANLFTRLCLDFLLQRSSPWRGHPARIIIDEAHLVAPVLSDVAELILTTGRSRGISIVSLTQGTGLIASANPTLLETMLTNTSAVIAGRMSALDSERLARSQAPRLGSDEPTSAVRARLAATLSNLPPREFVLLGAGVREQFRSVDQDMPALIAAAEHHEDTLQAIRARWMVPVSTAPRLRLNEAIDDRPDPEEPPPTQPRRRRRQDDNTSPWE